MAFNFKLNKVTLEPGRAHVVSAYETGFLFIIEGDLESYALISIGIIAGTSEIGNPVIIIEDGNIALTSTIGKTCIFNDNGLTKIQNDRVGQNINVGYIFFPYKFQ
jgi:hypothetical protein